MKNSSEKNKGTKQMGQSNGGRMSSWGFPVHCVSPHGTLGWPGSPETKGMSGWLLGCWVSYTKRLGGADSLLQSCTTFQAEGNLWALVSATPRHPRRQHESDMQDPSDRQVAVLWVDQGWAFQLWKAGFNHSHSIPGCRSLPAVYTHTPCLPPQAHPGYRWFLTQTERTKSWNLHIPEQWFLLKLPALAQRWWGEGGAYLWRARSNPQIFYTSKRMSREGTRLALTHLVVTELLWGLSPLFLSQPTSYQEDKIKLQIASTLLPKPSTYTAFKQNNILNASVFPSGLWQCLWLGFT